MFAFDPIAALAAAASPLHSVPLGASADAQGEGLAALFAALLAAASLQAEPVQATPELELGEAKAQPAGAEEAVVSGPQAAEKDVAREKVAHLDSEAYATVAATGADSSGELDAETALAPKQGIPHVAAPSVAAAEPVAEAEESAPQMVPKGVEAEPGERRASKPVGIEAPAKQAAPPAEHATDPVVPPAESTTERAPGPSAKAPLLVSPPERAPEPVEPQPPDFEAALAQAPASAPHAPAPPATTVAETEPENTESSVAASPSIPEAENARVETPQRELRAAVATRTPQSPETATRPEHPQRSRRRGRGERTSSAPSPAAVAPWRQSAERLHKKQEPAVPRSGEPTAATTERPHQTEQPAGPAPPAGPAEPACPPSVEILPPTLGAQPPEPKEAPDAAASMAPGAPEAAPTEARLMPQLKSDLPSPSIPSESAEAAIAWLPTHAEPERQAGGEPAPREAAPINEAFALRLEPLTPGAPAAPQAAREPSLPRVEVSAVPTEAAPEAPRPQEAVVAATSKPAVKPPEAAAQPAGPRPSRAIEVAKPDTPVAAKIEQPENRNRDFDPGQSEGWPVESPLERTAPKRSSLAPPPEAPPHPAAPPAPPAPPTPPIATAETRSSAAARPEPPPAEPAAPPRPVAMESAELTRRDDQTQFRLVLRDDRLGRVSLNITERAGLLDLMVRADKPATVRSLQDALPTLIDSLAQRNFRAETNAFAPSNPAGDARDASQERERRERRAHDSRPRIRSRRVAGAFQAAAE